MSHWPLCVPSTFYSLNLSDLISYQSILFAVIGAGFAVATRPELTDGQTATLLHAIFLALDHSDVPGETLVIPLVKGAPPEDIDNAISFFYESSLVSLLAVIFALLAKGCLSSYHLQEGVPAICRSENRRRRFDAFGGLTFPLLVNAPPLLLRSALGFLVLGLWQRLRSAHPTIIYPLVLHIVPGLVGYLGTIFNIFASRLRVALGTSL